MDRITIYKRTTRAGNGFKWAYQIDFHDGYSWLRISKYKDKISCGYVDKYPGEPVGTVRVNWLEFLVVTGLSKELVKDIKRERMDSMTAAKYLENSRDEQMSSVSI